MKTYEGRREGYLAYVRVNGRPLNPRLDLWNHSPTGFEWGYGGSGPAQLALALLADHLENDAAALNLYQDFKRTVVASLPYRGWRLTSEQIQAALVALKAPSLPQAALSFNDGPEGLGVMTTPALPVAKFRLGHIVATPNALNSLTNEDILSGIQRHQAGDWGDLPEEDKRENQLSLEKGFRLLSAYRAKGGTKFWIITEADRSSTTVLLPEDY